MFIGETSALPPSEIKKRPASEKVHVEETINGEVQEYDIAVRIPPKRRYSVELDIKRIRKAEPNIVEPESI
ncbi:MAG: hypothetical protein ACE14P_13460 [Methanotrichaceae archaeon]